MITRWALRFSFESPPILQGDLHLDAVLLALATQAGMPYEDAVRALPICQEDGIFRCSRLLWDGEPDVQEICMQRSVWEPTGLDMHRVTADKPFTKNDRQKNFKVLMDRYSSMDIPAGYFLAETEDPDALLSAAQGIPALGKGSRKGYGVIGRVEMEAAEQDPWVQRDGRPARALPVELWNARFGGEHALSMQVVSPPYWKNDAQLCAVESI